MPLPHILALLLFCSIACTPVSWYWGHVAIAAGVVCDTLLCVCVCVYMTLYHAKSSFPVLVLTSACRDIHVFIYICGLYCKAVLWCLYIYTPRVTNTSELLLIVSSYFDNIWNLVIYLAKSNITSIPYAPIIN